MATASKIVSDSDIQTMKNHIDTLQELRKEVVLAANAGIPLNVTAKDIDDQIASLQAIIKAYTPK